MADLENFGGVMPVQDREFYKKEAERLLSLLNEAKDRLVQQEREIQQLTMEQSLHQSKGLFR